MADGGPGSSDSEIPSDDSATADAEQIPKNALTYYADAKPIIDSRCVRCHTEGGIGPFPLTTYEEVKALKASVKNAVQERIMPPYLAGQKCTEYKHDTSLTDSQIETITKWVDQGAYKGDPANEGEPLPEVKAGLSRVDDTLQIPKAYKPQRSPDDYRCFPIEWNGKKTKYVTGFGVEPDKDQIVHHVIAYLADPSLSDEIEKKDKAEDGPGYTCFGGPGVGNSGSAGNSVGWLAAWAPGGEGMDFPKETGIEVEKGSTIILQMHYNTLTADPVADQTEILLKYADSVANPAMFIPFADPDWTGSDSTMDIPAGADGVSHTFTYDIASLVGSSVEIYDVFFHMHQLGEKGRLWIDKKGGNSDCLLNIPRWDFDWQRGYRLKQPRTLNKGDELGIECTWDNTRSNQPVINGERQSPRKVEWGEGTQDEMCLGVLYVTL